MGAALIDLNSGSGFVPGQDPAPPSLNDLIDAGLRRRAEAETRRTYLGGSRLGVECLRALQFEYTGTPVDPGREFSAQILRVFERGHRFEDMIAGWLRLAGLDLRTGYPDGRQFGFKTAGGRIAGHIDGVIVGMLDGSPCPIATPALWENKALNNKSWQDTRKKGVAISKPVYAGQIATYQAYMELTEAPAIFTAINSDTMEILVEEVPFDPALAQRMTDRGVQVLEATDANELLPRNALSRDHFGCRFCSWQDRCWRLPA